MTFNILVKKDYQVFCNNSQNIIQIPIADNLIHYRNVYSTPDLFIRRKVDYSKMKVFNEKFRKESERFESFAKFPHSKKHLINNLVLAGFYYIENDFYPDQVKCIYCQGILENWAKNDKPMKRHKFSYPTCPFIISLDVGDIPRCEYPIRMPDIDDDLGQYNKASLLDLECVFVIITSHIPMIYDSITHFNIDWREDTFVRHRSLMPLAMDGLFVIRDEADSYLVCCWCSKSTEILDDVETLDGGLFHYGQCQRYSPKSDISDIDPGVVKNYCNVEYVITAEEIDARVDTKILFKSIGKHSIKTTRENIKAIVERRLKEKGKDFDSMYEYLCSIVKYYKEKKPMKSPRADLVFPNYPLKDFQCVVCLDRPVEVVFLPCGHLKTCDYCSKVVTNCPVCRFVIERRVRNIQLHD